MWKFIQEHVFEFLLSVVIALITYIGTNELKDIHQEVCRVVATSADLSYDNISSSLGGLSSFDDLRDDSRPLIELRNFIDNHGSDLSQCAKGLQIKERMEALGDGLHAYLNKRYTGKGGAEEQFEKLDMSTSLPHYLLGYVFARVSEMSSNGEAVQSRKLAEDQFEKARQIAEHESGGTIKEAVLLRLKCKGYLVKRTDEANKQAVTCLKEIVAKGYDDYNTHYNLAALYSRQRQWDDTVSSFRQFLEKEGASMVTKNEIENDPDFGPIMASDRSGEFTALLNKYYRE